MARPRPVMLKNAMEAYYRERAREYDRFYEIPERQNDLRRLREWLIAHARGRTILEVAAGTGYWTEVAAPAARAITATDIHPELLALAGKRSLGHHVRLLAADAFALPEFAERFDAGMAHMWWSHVEKQRQQEFLSHFAMRLQPQAVLLMIDQIYVEGLSSPPERQDEWGNEYTIRTVDSGAIYEIIKNYPSPEDLKESLEIVCEDIETVYLRHFWAVAARIRPAARH
jgi:ubiquinone/menaquinone biosynthesis C-methylase UbiE